MPRIERRRGDTGQQDRKSGNVTQSQGSVEHLGTNTVFFVFVQTSLNISSALRLHGTLASTSIRIHIRNLSGIIENTILINGFFMAQIKLSRRPAKKENPRSVAGITKTDTNHTWPRELFYQASEHRQDIFFIFLFNYGLRLHNCISILTNCVSPLAFEKSFG